MLNSLVNWKTSLGGLIVIALGALTTFAGVKIPGFSTEFGSALPIGLALLFAKDNNVVGGGATPTVNTSA